MQVATDLPPDSSVLHPTRQQLLALRLVALGISIEHLEVLNSLLLGGRMPYNFLHDHWTLAVQDYLDGKPLFEVFTVQSYQDMMNLLPSGPYQVLLIDKKGQKFTDRAVTSPRYEGGKNVELPVDFFFYREAERAWEHCRSSKAVSLKKLVKTSLALAKRTKQGENKHNQNTNQPHKTPSQRPRQVPESWVRRARRG